MTMNRVIEYVDRIRPNIYTDDDKYLWLDKLEGLIAREVRKEDFPGYDLPREADLELAVPAPYDDLYSLYAIAMIDLCNREYDHYNNSMTVFADRYEQYKAWYLQNNNPAKALNFRNVMG